MPDNVKYARTKLSRGAVSESLIVSGSPKPNTHDLDLVCMAEFHDSLDKDLDIDDALQQYMYDIEQCTMDFSQTPPMLGGLSPVLNPGHLSGLGTGHGALQPSTLQASSPLDFQLPLQAFEETTDPTNEPSIANKRTQAWTAKNRRAQKRFRERQKVGAAPCVCLLIPAA